MDQSEVRYLTHMYHVQIVKCVLSHRTYAGRDHSRTSPGLVFSPDQVENEWMQISLSLIPGIAVLVVAQIEIIGMSCQLSLKKR